MQSVDQALGAVVVQVMEHAESDRDVAGRDLAGGESGDIGAAESTAVAVVTLGRLDEVRRKIETEVMDVWGKEPERFGRPAAHVYHVVSLHRSVVLQPR